MRLGTIIGGTQLMCHFVSQPRERNRQGAAPGFNEDSITTTAAAIRRRFCITLLVVCISLLSSAFAQVQPCAPNCAFLTSRGDIARAGANTNETLLAPFNVNKNSFGKLFTAPSDYMALAQPLYMPTVTIGVGPYAGTTHNVVYVVTQADSVYAFDADNGTQLWHVNFTNPALGITTAS